MKVRVGDRVVEMDVDGARQTWAAWRQALDDWPPVSRDGTHAALLARCLNDPVCRDLLAAYGSGYSLEVCDDYAAHLSDPAYADHRPELTKMTMLRIEEDHQRRVLAWLEWVNDQCPTERTLGATAWALWTMGRDEVAHEAAVHALSIGECTMAHLVLTATASQFRHPAHQ